MPNPENRVGRRELFKRVFTLGVGMAAGRLGVAGTVEAGEDSCHELKGGRERGGVKTFNIPDAVDPKRVDVAKGKFTSSGIAPQIFAEPGGLLVGPDFGSLSKNNPWGANPKGWETMYGSEGSIRPFSPVSQEVIRWKEPAYQNVPEGGFVILTGSCMTVRIGEKAIRMPDQGEGHNYLFAVRGRYADGKQDSDLNRTMEITGYRPGHTQVMMYESRWGSNLGFVSEGQFLQDVATSHTTGTNCGAEGCSRLTVVTLDVNTGAFDVLRHAQGRPNTIQEAIEMAGKGWELAYSNWRSALGSPTK